MGGHNPNLGTEIGVSLAGGPIALGGYELMKHGSPQTQQAVMAGALGGLPALAMTQLPRQQSQQKSSESSIGGISQDDLNKLRQSGYLQ
jgi:hypothetical protein